MDRARFIAGIQVLLDRKQGVTVPLSAGRIHGESHVSTGRRGMVAVARHAFGAVLGRTAKRPAGCFATAENKQTGEQQNDACQ